MSRPLRLHSSALSDAEFDYFTSTLSLLTDCLPPSDSTRDDKDFATAAELPVSGLCAWLLGKLCPLFPHEVVATIMTSVASNEGTVDGTQFFAVARLALHCLNGETIGDANDCRRLAFVQVAEIASPSPSPPSRGASNVAGTSRQLPPGPKLRVHLWSPEEDKPCQFEFAFPESGLFHPESQSRTFQAAYGPDMSLAVYTYYDSAAHCWTTTPEPLRVSRQQPMVHLRPLPRRDETPMSRKRPRTSDVTSDTSVGAASRLSATVQQPPMPATPAPSPSCTKPPTPAPPPASAPPVASVSAPLPPSTVSAAASFSIPLTTSASARLPVSARAPTPAPATPATSTTITQAHAMPPGHPLPSSPPGRAVEGLKPAFVNKEEAYLYLMQNTAPWHASTYWKHHRLYAKREGDARLQAAVAVGMCEAGEWSRFLREEETAGRVQEGEVIPATPST
ncbi:hypothetical protein BD626DRAFT_498760 [Schizophyllum amplum]|uniref:Uncharacterized protein n=1 Tax=Schizophyllum amplum TaxID=97359 RepID=A0A550CBW1_9AGAR|nr:hypothetical protein BD626DRAFT_498760 [Auriculariopsis ampla]